MAAAADRCVTEDPILSLDYVVARFPLQSLFVCCCVSKSLSNLIKCNSDFAQLHYKTSEPQLLVHRTTYHYSNFHLVDLDANTTSPVQVNPSFNLPLRGFDFAQSCNGLLLLVNTNIDTDFQQCIVLNPVTGEYVRLPETVYPCRNARCAFFFNPETNQFKVFRVFHRTSPSDATSDSFKELDPTSDSASISHSAFTSHSATIVDLVSDPDSKLVSDPDSKLDSDSNSDSSTYYDSDSTSDSDSDSVHSASDITGEIFVGGSDSWESLGNLPFSPLTIYHPCHLGKATHWLCEDENVPSLIVFFNFETHQVGEIPGPTHLTKTQMKTHAKENAYDYVTLVILGECLSIFDGFTSETNFDVWVMKNYGNQDSWSLKYVINTTAWAAYSVYYRFRPVICRKNEEVVMVRGDGYMIFYDLLKTRGKIFYHPPLEQSWNVLFHTPSFISLREVARGSNLEVLNVAPRFVDPELNVLNYLELVGSFPE